MRELKGHEKKLLKKVDFLQWKREGGHREANIMRRYHITSRDDYKKYSSICRMVQKQVHLLKQMNPNDPFRIKLTGLLLEKLWDMGVIQQRKSLAFCEKLSVSCFLRRRLSTVMVRKKYVEQLKAAVTYIEQGHIMVGTNTITDPAYLVTRNAEDSIKWEPSSKINKAVQVYHGKYDDYDAMN
ncbi:hypothetical protein IFM89_018933 [Coptis chinensis]|uniref:Small ribosomal subunit protein uS4 N-terminal domain-containing protein n=1 Tax=Coptis chinensis TaxID=261450 RepID=A0A835ICS3_9MAGN|nr:hypothetical protein IFM89_018933 [Coptis chinensis]